MYVARGTFLYGYKFIRLIVTLSTWSYGLPIIPWFMTLHKEDEKHHSILELLYNCKHKWGKLVVENTFGILKQTFIELLKKTKLHVTIVLNVFN
jgi:hypothetical protein